MGLSYKAEAVLTHTHPYPMPRLATKGSGIWPALGQPRGVVGRAGGTGPLGSPDSTVPSPGAQPGRGEAAPLGGLHPTLPSGVQTLFSPGPGRWQQRGDRGQSQAESQ